MKIIPETRRVQLNKIHPVF